MGETDLGRLKELVIPSFVLDPRPLPPHAVIAGLTINGRPVGSWEDLAGLSQRERSCVIKPSGFSEEAWGSHGVKFGSDMPREDWTAVLKEALSRFPERPWILQPFQKARVVKTSWFDPSSGSILAMEGRTRLCPYYFVTGEDTVTLGGALATICPADKKAIHGMPDAIMVPCMIEQERAESHG
jgi:hypothetical protein